jgi:hypothetical protein
MKARPFTLQSLGKNLQATTMANHDESEILLVEDNSADADRILRTLKKNPLNTLHWVEDGEAVRDFIFRNGAYASRAIYHFD